MKDHALQPETDPRWYRLWHVCALLSLPWLMLLANPRLFMTPGGNRYLDPWVYTGFFLSLPQHLKLFPGTYYGTRLSWLLPGYLAHRTFSPLVANYVLHIGFYYGLLIATYQLVTRAIDRRSALLAATFMASSPVILAALSWDYVDGAGIVFTVACLLCLEAVVRKPGAIVWRMTAGAAFGCMISANLFLAIFVPVFGVFAYTRAGRSRAREWPAIVASVAAGTVIALVLLAAANHQLGGPWLFLAPQFQASRVLLSSPSDYRLPLGAWVPGATWLVLPVVATAAAVRGVVRASGPPTAFVRSIHAALLTAAALFIVLQTARTPVLQIPYYASYLGPFALLALSLEFRFSAARLSPAAALGLELFALLLFAAVHFFIVSRLPLVWAALSPWFDGRLWAAVWGVDYRREVGFLTALSGAIGLLMVFGARHAWSARQQWIWLTLGMTALACAAPGDLPQVTDLSNPGYFAVTVAAHRYMEKRIDFTDRKLRLWYSGGAVASPTVAVANTFFWGTSIVNNAFPSLTADEASRLGKDTHLVLLLPAFADVEIARGALRRRGVEIASMSHEDFQSGGQTLSVVTVDLK